MQLATASNRICAEEFEAQSQASHSPRLLLCPPEYFEVSYQINPWMTPDIWRRDHNHFRALAQAQWSNLNAIYHHLGYEVVTAPPVQGLPDMVFTANSAIVLDGKALLARFCHPQRQGEEVHFAAFFQELKSRGLISDIITPPKDVVFEGAGDAVWDPHRKIYWFGHSQRSTRNAAEVVAESFATDVVSLEMVTSRYYHLDVALAPLSSGHVVYIADAFDEVGRRAIAERVGNEELLIPATAEDAANFAVNAVNIGEDIITAYMSVELRRQLEGLGYRVHVTPLNSFQMAGGGAFCLTLKLDNKR